jgi:chromosome segregation ATPase
MAQINEESLKELTQALTDLKVNTTTIVVKMEQIYDSMERLETSIEKLEKTTESISNSVSSQEKRLTVLEQNVPAHLMQDLAVLKSTQDTQSKILWLVGSGTALALIQALIKAIQ